LELHFRPYAREDHERVLAICLAAFAPIHEGFAAALGPALFRIHYAHWREDYAAMIATWPPADPAARVHLACRGAEIAGFVETRLDPANRAGEIHIMAVDPALQRRGIGRRLCEFALDELRGRGATSASVGTGGDAAHAPARALYAAAGFTRSVPAVHLFRLL